MAGLPITGPPPPVAPATVSRDAEGRATLRAIRLSEPLKLDGKLDEPLYAEPSISDFTQMEPKPGAPATERTEVWLAFDQKYLYLTVKCWDSQPESRWVLDEMRRDSSNIPRNENVAFFFDTFYDKRSAVLFEATPLGAIYDAQAQNLRPGGADWNPIWIARPGRFEGGWTLEMAIPFKSLRYRPGTEQVWGFNLRRTVRWKNENSFITRLPLIAGFSGDAAIFQVANGATVVGIQAPEGSKNIEIKPYVVGSTTTDRTSRPPRENDGNGDFGVDFKYGLTPNLTTDFTYNTDFAQVEVDAQQVNLTRFSLFFPEKRDFFLEGQSIFDFGGASSGGASAGGTTPLLFFSRSIGLNQGRPTPIQGGGRLTGRAGKFTLGLLDVRADKDPIGNNPATNFTTVRVRRDILNRSSVGMLFTDRSALSGLAGHGRTYGIDSNFNLKNFVTINAYAARTDTPTVEDNDTSYRVQASYNKDRYGLEFDRLSVGDNFNPAVGFVQRDNFERTYLLGRFSPRPKNNTRIRKYTYQGIYDRFDNASGNFLESRPASGLFSVELQNTDKLTVQYKDDYERLSRPFAIARGVTIPVGAYPFRSVQGQLLLGNQRKASGTVTVERGSFYTGTKTTLNITNARTQFSPRISVEPSLSMNWIDLVQGTFTNTVVSTRATFTVQPRMFVSGILQYASATTSLGSNIRFRWEYQPGSELFVVYTDELDTTGKGSTLRNRAFVVKATRLVRF